MFLNDNQRKLLSNTPHIYLVTVRWIPCIKKIMYSSWEPWPVCYFLYSEVVSWLNIIFPLTDQANLPIWSSIGSQLQVSSPFFHLPIQGVSESLLPGTVAHSASRCESQHKNLHLRGLIDFLVLQLCSSSSRNENIANFGEMPNPSKL